MASGISLNMGAGAGIGNAPPWLTGGSSTGTSNAQSGIFGPQPTSSTGSSGALSDYLSALNPLSAFGLTLVTGIAAVVLLIVIRQSLPR